MRRAMAVLSLLALAGCSAGEAGDAPAAAEDAASEAPAAATASARPALIELWSQGKPAFGVFVPNENPRRRGEPPAEGPSYTVAGGERLAANPLYDFVFLNLEGRYDPQAVEAIATGLRSGDPASRKTLIVRIPSIESDGVEATRARVREVLAMGADGVTLPHVRSVEEARTAISFFEEAGANVWSPSNPGGDKIAMLMVEDPEAVAAAAEIASLPGYSVLATGIGSLRSALGGDAAGAEAGTQRVLAETKRAGLANVLTANSQDVEKRIREGFLGLLMQGEQADEAIRIGRTAAGR